MSIVLGKNVNLYGYWNGSYKVLACGKSCTYSLQTEVGEMTTTESGKWKQFKGLALSWSVSFEGDIFYQRDFTVRDLYNIQVSLLPVRISFELVDTDGNTVTYTGNAVIEKIDQTGDVSSPGTFSASLVGEGEMTTSYDPPTTTQGSVNILYYTATGGETSVSDAALVDKDVLVVFKDTDAMQVVSTTPGNQQAQYVQSTGVINFDHTLQPGEIVQVLYQ